MRKTHEVLRLSFEGKLGIRAIARSLRVSPSAVGDAGLAGKAAPIPERPRPWWRRNSPTARHSDNGITTALWIFCVLLTEGLCLLATTFLC